MPTTKASAKRGEQPTRRRVLLARELSDAEMAAIRAAQVKADVPYNLDDLDDEGNLVSRKPSDRAR
ncbi:Hypothetical protein RG1141_CH06450 [Neorhizobium galegae bv. officinalis bv. officinalis str. HAMBI 1141]|uniref:Uncharacterized protein n=1 Tax=Neorhizobium galegae bv. officinalis bv. officinalis str. HAMBI 1141 TaxID=1028801 RepID=A0A068T4N2_NEOGA|nr:hypothetical protein [Neorhizobium galegae]CDN53006.1 Hypothetical protein RG1141_CH06450 [Neorhizobium galegae bv. officinalis bv. officinalis str. HAMBI 1141]